MMTILNINNTKYRQFLNLFFNPDEGVCVSHNKYAYHSVTQNSIYQNQITLSSPNIKILPKKISIDEINLLTINPIVGFRNDNNITAFRSFLVELDEGSLAEQKSYIDSIKLPYSCCVFSGNKSLHFGIVLSQDLVDIYSWKTINNWILNILSKADQQTKNPSRNIRFPNNIRIDTGNKQSLVYLGQRISQAQLFGWLNQYPDLKPKQYKKPSNIVYSTLATFSSLPSNIKEWLNDGVHNLSQGKNTRWFVIASVCADKGFSIEDTVGLLSVYFTPTPQFKEREWITTIKSAFKRSSLDY